ncbi:hypothetical protein GHK31_19290, partial [Sinorhizobium meliloti]|nr:hypothetical protein [Sinorhizobium meliloti]
FDFLIPVLVTGIQPDQVLGLKELLPRRRRGAALISVTSTEMRVRRDCSLPIGVLQRRESYQTRKGRCSTLICCMFLSFDRLRSKDTCSRSRSRY